MIDVLSKDWNRATHDKKNRFRRNGLDFSMKLQITTVIIELPFPFGNG